MLRYIYIKHSSSGKLLGSRWDDCSRWLPYKGYETQGHMLPHPSIKQSQSQNFIEWDLECEDFSSMFKILITKYFSIQFFSL